MNELTEEQLEKAIEVAQERVKAECELIDVLYYMYIFDSDYYVNKRRVVIEIIWCLMEHDDIATPLFEYLNGDIPDVVFDVCFSYKDTQFLGEYAGKARLDEEISEAERDRYEDLNDEFKSACECYLSEMINEITLDDLIEGAQGR